MPSRGGSGHLLHQLRVEGLSSRIHIEFTTFQDGGALAVVVCARRPRRYDRRLVMFVEQDHPDGHLRPRPELHCAMTSRWEQRYWSVDVPGLDAAGAAELAAHARQLPGVSGPSGVDPDVWLTQHLDRDTVAMLLRALTAALATGGLNSDEGWEVGQLADDLQGWLDATGRSGAE